MIKHLFLALLFGGTLSAHAQMSNLVNGLGLAGRLATQRSTPQQKAALFVLPATYQAHTFPQKRTPTKKVPRADQGGTEIAALEQLLAGRFAALQADSTMLLLDGTQEKEFSRLRSNLEAFNPFWNTDSYSEEMNLYRSHDANRQRLARQAAK
ncbi:hypothetical protein GCM10027422_28690 [Hymenobacter arcticus]